MQPNLCLPKTLLRATLPLVHYLSLSRLPFHHTCARRRRHSCQYHATCPSPTKTLPGATLAPLHHTSSRRRHHSHQYHAICPSPTQNATWRYFTAFSPYLRPPTPPLMSIPCNLPFSYQKRYLALLRRHSTLPAIIGATAHVNTMQPTLRLPKTLPGATFQLLHQQSPWLLPFHIPVHADATTRAIILPFCLRLPKTLLGATLPPVHHTNAQQRHRPCQYRATHRSPTNNATWRYFSAIVSPY